MIDPVPSAFCPIGGPFEDTRMRSCFVLCVGILTAGSLLADPKKEAPSRPASDTNTFLVYVLEDLYRDTAPDAPAFQRAGSLESFIVERRLLANELRRYIEKQVVSRAAEKTRDELAGLYAKYAAVLDQADPAIRGIKESDDKFFWRKRRELIERFEVFRAIREAEATAALLEAFAAGYERSGGNIHHALFAGWTMSMFKNIQLTRDLLAEAAQIRHEWKAHVQAVKAEGAYAREVAQHVDAFWKKVEPLRAAECARTRTTAQLIASAGGGISGDLFDPLAPLTPSANLQRPGDVLRTVRLIEIRSQSPESQNAKARMQTARAYLDAAARVPSSPAFNFVRARIYRLAGEEANLASASELGSASFVKGVPTRASQLGLKAWIHYLDNQPPDKRFSGHVLHQVMLADVYASRYDMAYDTLRKHREIWPADPAFLFDAARVCSIRAETMRDKDAQTVVIGEAKELFGWAVFTGFHDFAVAKETRDLQRLRKKAAQWFEETVSVDTPP